MKEEILNKELETIVGYEGEEFLKDFRWVSRQRARWSDILYQVDLEIQYFTYYVVLIELHGNSSYIRVLKHEVFHPNKNNLKNSSSDEDEEKFVNEVDKLCEKQNGTILQGALLDRLQKLVYYTHNNYLEQHEEGLKRQVSLGDFSLKGIHEEAYNYFRFGIKPLWYEEFLIQKRNIYILNMLGNWTWQSELGIYFNYLTSHKIFTDRKRSPVGFWKKKLENQKSLSFEEQEKFVLIRPDFVVEACSTSDLLEEARFRMNEYIENGTRLGWIFIHESQQVEIFRPNQKNEILQSPIMLSGEDVLLGFVLDLKNINGGIFWHPK